MTCILCSGISVGACASSSSALVSSGNEFHVAWVFFPCPTNADQMLEPETQEGQVIPDRLLFGGLLNIEMFDVFLFVGASKLEEVLSCVGQVSACLRLCFDIIIWAIESVAGVEHSPLWSLMLEPSNTILTSASSWCGHRLLLAIFFNRPSEVVAKSSTNIFIKY